MKQSIRLIAVLFVCFAINLFLPSCGRDAKFAGKSGKPLSGPILIKGFDVVDSSLALEDSVTGNNAIYVIVSKNLTVDWVNKNSKILILNIAPDSKYQANDPAFFSDLPQRVGKSNRWRAKIGSPANNGILIEKYFIEWQLKSNGKTYHFDPLLQLNP